MTEHTCWSLRQHLSLKIETREWKARNNKTVPTPSKINLHIKTLTTLESNFTEIAKYDQWRMEKIDEVTVRFNKMLGEIPFVRHVFEKIYMPNIFLRDIGDI